MKITKLPNIVLIVMDTAKAKNMSLYGYNRKTTPNLERIAESSVVYNKCFAPAPWTIPSHASLFTGVYPSQHGCDGFNYCLPDKFYTMAEILKINGYITFGITNNVLVSSALAFDRGFDHFTEIWKYFSNRELSKLYKEVQKGKNKKEKFKKLIGYFSQTRDFTNSYKFIFNRLYLRFVIKDVGFDSTAGTNKSIKLAKKIISEKYDKPFFLFINFMQTHGRYNPPRNFRNIFVKDNTKFEKRNEKLYAYRRHYALTPFEKDYLQYLEGLYDQEFLFLDSKIWELYEYIYQERLLDNTIFIITSDHGEFFGEHGHIGHVFTTYNELIHIPLIIKYPSDFRMTAQKDNIVQLHDLFATISEVINSPIPTSESSFSLLSQESRKYAISQLLDVRFKIGACLELNPDFNVRNFMQSYMSIVTEDLFKFTKAADSTEEIYDLNSDFYENANMIEDPIYVDKINELRSLLDSLDSITGFQKVIPKETSIDEALGMRSKLQESIF